MEKIYPLTNKGGIYVDGKLKKGSCIGYSLVWLQEMLNGTPPKIPPDTGKGQIVAGGAALFAYNIEYMVGVMCKKLELVSEQVGKLNYVLASMHVSTTIGYYLLDLKADKHIVAVSNNNNTWYYFDANEGLYSANKSDDFHRGVYDKLRAYRKSRTAVRIFAIRKFTRAEELLNN